MKRKLLLRYAGIMTILLSLTAGLILEGCHPESRQVASSAKFYYTCPMHPQIHEDQPGDCPICGMKLVKVEPAASEGAPLDSALSYLEEPVTKTVVGDFKVISPEKIKPADTITADGYTGFDERALNTVASRVSGRIEKLYIKYTNQSVHQGEPLMKIYSPRLLSVQRDLLQAVKNKDTVIIVSLKENLYNLGMYRQEVEQVMQTGQPLADITIYSPYPGISRSPGNSAMNGEVNNMGTDNSINMQASNTSSSNASSAPELLTIREGMYVNAGQTVFSIQDISRVWALLNAFNKDVPNIRVGDPAGLSAAADQVNIIRGKVDFIPSYRVENEKTTRVRVYLSRLPENWKIGTLLRGWIATSGSRHGWSVPVSAVNRLGTSSVVWVQDKQYPHVFHASKVSTAEQTGDHILITSGLHDGDKIAENASYMVDSDSFIE